MNDSQLRQSSLEYLQRSTSLVLAESIDASNLIGDDNVNVAMLCDALKRIFSHKLKSKLSFC